VHLDTFRPIQETHVVNHTMHSEYCEVSSYAAQTLLRVKQNGKKIIACGTTAVRALETAAHASKPGLFEPFSGFTDLYIRPGFSFRAVDALITNFHVPKSTLLVLKAAFMGYDFMWKAYEEAMKKNYRFFSFGDAMLIL